MGKEKKKQHFVPRGYLEQWAIPGKYQVYVYNKQQKKSYPQLLKLSFKITAKSFKEILLVYKI
jgi:hypothetical protein